MPDAEPLELGAKALEVVTFPTVFIVIKSPTFYTKLSWDDDVGK